MNPEPNRASEPDQDGAEAEESATPEAVDLTPGAYDASAITVLEGLEAVRKRPGMYIGSTGERGLHHLVYEVVDNAVDEAMAGVADTINVRLLADGGVEVTDNGRGIPSGIHPTEGIATITVVLTKLHAGGKFGGAGYKVSGGLHGVGVSVVNALSSKLEVEVKNDGYYWHQEFRLGDPVAELVRGKETTETGTTVRFWPSTEIFETTDFSFDTLARRLREMAFLNKGLTIAITDERDQNAEAEEVEADAEVTRNHHTFRYDDGLIDFVKYLNVSKDAIGSVIDVSDTAGGASVEIAMQWNQSYTESVHTFANAINTHEGGTHEEGFRAALTYTVNKFADHWAMLRKNDPKLAGEDIREGLTAIVSIKLTEPQFEGQTKTKLGNTEAKSLVQRITNDKLGAWFEQNPGQAKDILRKAQAASVARIAARKARDNARDRKGLLGRSGLPGKLIDCQSTDPSECEVFIVEGDSAGGSARGGRDPRTQAILPIRGKILNVEKARIDRILQNQEVQAIIAALGTGIHEDFAAERLRYHKIVLMADADVDGAHIRTLLLTLVFRFMRPLIEGGYIYLAHPPLYKLKWTNAPHELAYTDAERDGLRRIGEEAGKRLPKEAPIQRYKGLGEMNPDELWETTMDPQARVLMQVDMDDAVRADEMFSILMGEDVEQRRIFIQRNAKDVRFLDI